MLLAYKLTMPRINTWNNHWSGENKLYGIVKNVRLSKKNMNQIQSILDGSPYHYNWSDGWGARIEVSEVKPSEAAKIRRKSDGFLGYEWMVESIELDQKIIAPSDRKATDQQKGD